MPTRESNIKEGVEDQLKIEEQSGPNLCTGVPMMTDQVQSILEERDDQCKGFNSLKFLREEPGLRI